MGCLVKALLCVCLATGARCTAPSSSFFDSNFVEKAQNAMQKECGHPCLLKFEEMLGWLEANSEAILSGKMLGTLNATKLEKATPPMLAWIALANREVAKVRLLQGRQFFAY